ncbi:MAG: hypothetical protein Q4C63_08590 [Eubacteriales bacterium]|nr:hypothetical protein [Eubacteriales bacterium]
MKIELNVYTTKAQRQMLRKIRRRFLLTVLTPLRYILPLTEAVTAVAVLFLMCCTDSENLSFVIRTGALAVLILGASICLNRYVQNELYLLHRRRLVRSI